MTTAYDFATPVNEDITLYAKWTPVAGKEEEKEEPTKGNSTNKPSSNNTGSGVTLSDTAGKSSHSTIGKTGMTAGTALSVAGLGAIASALATWKKRKK